MAALAMVGGRGGMVGPGGAPIGPGGINPPVSDSVTVGESVNHMIQEPDMFINHSPGNLAAWQTGVRVVNP